MFFLRESGKPRSSMIRRFWIAALFIGSTAWAGPTIHPSTATVFMRGSVTITSTDTITCFLAAGSTGTLSGCTYTAPASFYAKNIVAGCPVTPNDSIFNTDVSGLPVDGNSGTRIGNVAGGPTLRFEVDFPLNVMTNATPTDTMNFFYTSQFNGQSWPIVAAPYRGVENALYPTDYFAQDRHQHGVNTDTCKFTEIYNYYPVGTATIPEGCASCNAQSGFQYDGTSYRLPDESSGNGSTDAAGLPVEPLLIKYSELKAGHIDHAMRFTMSNGYNYAGFLWPGTNFSPQCGNFSTCFPYGSRLRLKVAFNVSSFSSTAQVILNALKKYGMFMADGGTTMAIQTWRDVDSDTTTWNVFHNELLFNSGPTINDFEQVNETGLIVSSDTSRVYLNNASAVLPSNYAVVYASKTSDSTTSFLYIAVQPVTVGTNNTPFPSNDGSLNVMVGTPQFQIPFWVNGSSTTTATFSMSPTLGSLTAGGLYTAPTGGVTASSTTNITIVNTLDSTATITFPLTVFPANGIRMVVGAKAGTITSPVIPYDALSNYGLDVGGNYWAMTPVGNVPAWYALDDQSYPQASWPPGTLDVGLYYTDRHGSSDQAWAAMVPNGTYTLNLKFGANSGNVGVQSSSVTIDSQGTVVMTTATVPIPGFASYTPSDKFFTIPVTNNQFYFAIRQVYNSNFTLLSAWSLTPAVSAIQIQGTVNFRGSLKFASQ